MAESVPVTPKSSNTVKIIVLVAVVFVGLLLFGAVTAGIIYVIAGTVQPTGLGIAVAADASEGQIDALVSGLESDGRVAKTQLVSGQELVEEIASVAEADGDEAFAAAVRKKADNAPAIIEVETSDRSEAVSLMEDIQAGRIAAAEGVVEDVFLLGPGEVARSIIGAD